MQIHILHTAIHIHRYTYGKVTRYRFDLFFKEYLISANFRYALFIAR